MELLPIELNKVIFNTFFDDRFGFLLKVNNISSFSDLLDTYLRLSYWYSKFKTIEIVTECYCKENNHRSRSTNHICTGEIDRISYEYERMYPIEYNLRPMRDIPTTGFLHEDTDTRYFYIPEHSIIMTKCFNCNHLDLYYATPNTYRTPAILMGCLHCFYRQVGDMFNKPPNLPPPPTKLTEVLGCCDRVWSSDTEEDMPYLESWSSDDEYY